MILDNNQYFMFDLETLSLNTTASIMQIGAVIVGDESSTFKRTIKYDSEFPVDYETLCWWMEQDTEARRSVFNKQDAMSLRYTLIDFANWCTSNLAPEKRNFLVAHGYDLRLLMYRLEQEGGELLPFSYQNWIDLRSFQREAEWKGLNFDIPKVKPRHNALSDAIWQGRWFHKYLISLEK